MIGKIKFNSKKQLALFVNDQEVELVDSIEIEQQADMDMQVIKIVFCSEKGTNDMLDEINKP